MYQKVILVGRLGRDPEMRYTPDGKPVASFSVATDRHWTDANGQRQEKTVWFRVTAWGKQAETCNTYLAKGRQVMVEGELDEPRTYQGKDGTWRASLDVRATNVRFLGGRAEGGEQQAAAVGDAGDEEVPF